jgi:hypothetical protein
MRVRFGELVPYAEDPGPASPGAGRLVARCREIAVTAPSSPEHVPLRPTWLCRTCAFPWPCAQARHDLLADHADDLVFLAVFMASTMAEAVRDLVELHPATTPTPAQIWDRFMQWLDAARRDAS